MLLERAEFGYRHSYGWSRAQCPKDRRDRWVNSGVEIESHLKKNCKRVISTGKRLAKRRCRVDKTVSAVATALLGPPLAPPFPLRPFRRRFRLLKESQPSPLRNLFVLPSCSSENVRLFD